MPSTLQTFEKIDGKKVKRLRIECRSCKLYAKGFKDKKCYKCLFNTIFENKKKDFFEIYIECLDEPISSHTTSILTEYFKYIKKIKKIIEQISQIREEDCIYKDFQCKLDSSNHLFTFNDQDMLFAVDLYIKCKTVLKNLKSRTIDDITCSECKKKIINHFKDLLELLEATKIIQKYHDFQKSSGFSNSYYFYEFLITRSHSPESLHRIKQGKKEGPIDKYKTHLTKVLETYPIHNEMYKVKIFNVKNRKEKYYNNILNFEESEKSYYLKVVDDITNKMDVLQFSELVELEDLIELYKIEAERYLENEYTLNSQIKEKFSYYIAIKFIHLDKIFPLLLDDYIEEIFLDSPNGYLYLNHQKYGRCRTTIKFNEADIKRIITLLRLYSGKNVNYSSPTLKYVLKNKYFYCRFAIDIAPVNINDFSLDIRKLDKNILTIQDLLKYETLSPKMAAFLYFCILNRVNLTVTGETDTGKTTLINAFDLICPLEFRKIYVENIPESLNQFGFEKHQLKFKANSLEENETEYKKSKHIKTLLHRTPDIIFLGEILTKEECKAMFHCLAAGLRGFQTIHSSDTSSLINRFIHTFGIKTAQLSDLDLIILMKRSKERKRRIAVIVELDLLTFQAGGGYSQKIFSYDPSKEDWNLTKKLYHTRTVKNICKYEFLPEKQFTAIIDLYSEIFEYLYHGKKMENDRLIDFFDQLAYHSSHPSKIKEFWLNWKNENNILIKTNELAL
jgi:type IV secretory pathway ATPase VirB11/archaellum biosynthesis ATPase